MDQVFKCDPSKNTVCDKKNCFINGGVCANTHNIDFAKQPIETVTFVMSAEEAKPILEAIGEDAKNDKE